MASRPLPCPTVLRLLLRYEPETGKLFWRDRPRCFCKNERGFNVFRVRDAGTEAFTARRSGGYPAGKILGVRVAAHRVAFAMHYGRWPAVFIDHKNRDRADNRICNLREATPSENARNSVGNVVGRQSRFKGVHLMKRGASRWRAVLKVGKKSIYCGHYATEEEAARGYDAGALEHFGEFALLNFP